MAQAGRALRYREVNQAVPSEHGTNYIWPKGMGRHRLGRTQSSHTLWRMRGDCGGTSGSCREQRPLHGVHHLPSLPSHPSLVAFPHHTCSYTHQATAPALCLTAAPTLLSAPQKVEAI